MFGRKTFPAHAAAAEREAAILRRGIVRANPSPGSVKLVLGTRRHNSVYVDDLCATWEASGLTVVHTAGRELCHCAAPSHEGERGG